MSRRLTTVIVTVGLCLWLSMAAYAQEKSLEINVFGGGSWYSIKKYDIAFPQSVTPVAGEFRMDHALRAGLRAPCLSSFENTPWAGREHRTIPLKAGPTKENVGTDVGTCRACPGRPALRPDPRTGGARLAGRQRDHHLNPVTAGV